MTMKSEALAAKRVAVVARLNEINENAEILAGMWDERTLDTLILALGIGHVELNDRPG